MTSVWQLYTVRCKRKTKKRLQIWIECLVVWWHVYLWIHIQRLLKGQLHSNCSCGPRWITFLLPFVTNWTPLFSLFCEKNLDTTWVHPFCAFTSHTNRKMSNGKLFFLFKLDYYLLLSLLCKEICGCTWSSTLFLF